MTPKERYERDSFIVGLAFLTMAGLVIIMTYGQFKINMSGIEIKYIKICQEAQAEGRINTQEERTWCGKYIKLDHPPDDRNR